MVVFTDKKDLLGVRAGEEIFSIPLPICARNW
jgi:hypothetical protein